MEVHRFNGQNVNNWVYKIEKFFDLHRVEPVLRLSVVAFHLGSEPATWYQWMDNNKVLKSWVAFIDELKKRFGASIYDDPLGRISKLIQSVRITKYRAEFEELMIRITGVSECMFLNFFIWGLKPEIRRELLIFPPVSLVEAMDKAQLYEDRIDNISGRARKDEVKGVRGGFSTGGKMSSLANTSGHTSVKPVTLTPVSNSQNTGGNPSVNSSLPIKRLSPAEVNEKREKGLCFNCDEKYSHGLRCKTRFLLSFDEDELKP